MEYILLVTWLVNNQPPSSYQTTYGSRDACEVARHAVLKEATRLKAEHEKAAYELAPKAGIRPEHYLLGKPAPSVSAVCTSRNSN